ncbi:hypothetical protein [Massilia scottii]|uniref:hypothetical protein n=1 Tax=Massilia scottii TaxID=3057166 RepID=UPI0027964236|nr:hypothetical protein [Massilia sp. CCM 9029]MDQ1833231.1 hypothetical protein [Massilia sp. CCM 9029]
MLLVFVLIAVFMAVLPLPFLIRFAIESHAPIVGGPAPAFIPLLAFESGAAGTVLKSGFKPAFGE